MTPISPSPKVDIFADILNLARRHYLDILISAAVFLSIALIYLHAATYRYTIDLQVTPVAQPSFSEGGQVSNLASLVGVSLPGGQSTASFQLYLDALQSRVVADKVAQNTQIMRALFPDSWSEQENRWRDPNTIARAADGMFRALVGAPAQPWLPPSGQDLQLFLTRELRVVKLRTSPVVTISVDLADRNLGARLLLAVHAADDEVLRQRTLTRSSGDIAYLRTELDKVTVADYREAILRVLADEEKQQMMARSNISFAAEPFGAPVSSSRPVSPKAVMVLPVSLVLGIIAGFGLAWLRHRYDWRFGSPSAMRWVLSNRAPHRSR